MSWTFHHNRSCRFTAASLLQTLHETSTHPFVVAPPTKARRVKEGRFTAASLLQTPHETITHPFVVAPLTKARRVEEGGS